MGADTRQEKCISISLSTSFTMAENSVDRTHVGTIWIVSKNSITHSGIEHYGWSKLEDKGYTFSGILKSMSQQSEVTYPSTQRL